MEKNGYKNFYQVLNAKDYGIPQNRERVFTISILGDNNFMFPIGEECDNKIDVVGNYMPSNYDASRIVSEDGLAPTVKENHGTVTAVAMNFQFPKKQDLKLKLKDLLEYEVDEKYYLNTEQIKNIKESTFLQSQRRIQEKDYCDTLCARDWKDPRGNVPLVSRMYGIFDTETSKHQAGSVYDKEGLCPTLDTMQDGYRQPHIEEGSLLKYDSLRIRKLTPKECWRLMGFSDEEFEKLKQLILILNCINRLGNSIVVKVLEEIFKNLLKKEI